MEGVYFFGHVKTNDQNILKSASSIKNAVSNICKKVDLKIVGENHYNFKGSDGITYCFILSQSHFIVHTWPEEDKIFFDIFTCNKEIDEKKYSRVISSEFKGEVMETKKVECK